MDVQNDGKTILLPENGERCVHSCTQALLMWPEWIPNDIQTEALAFRTYGILEIVAIDISGLYRQTPEISICCYDNRSVLPSYTSDTYSHD